MQTQRSQALMQQARSYFVGGVNSPVRAFNGVGGEPIVAARGEGPYIEDVDGNRYIDFILSWGPLILGHADPEVVEAVCEAVARGTSFGMPSEAENRLAHAIRGFFPECEKMRLVNSGTEATMSALRTARGFTGRDKILKFVGCYHGHSDALLVDAGSGLATLGTPSSPGVTQGTTRDTVTVPFNNCEALRDAFQRYGGELAAAILEVLPCNAGMLMPDPEFLALLQDLCGTYETLLIADEVLTGLRTSAGGAYHRFGIQPDLVCLGKVIGGGFPIAAYGGRREIMAALAPEGGVYQAGTLSGNPVAATAGAVTLERLQQSNPFSDLDAAAARVANKFREAAAAQEIALHVGQVGSIFALTFAHGAPRNHEDMGQADQTRYAKLFWALLERGVSLAPSGFEVGFLSTAHDNQALTTAETAIAAAMAAISD